MIWHCTIPGKQGVSKAASTLILADTTSTETLVPSVLVSSSRFGRFDASPISNPLFDQIQCALLRWICQFLP
uniref:Uncharacterized protein n=1 Tax=Arundo donax TaxID=35708 RepID=A0A0A9GZX5_ARUDO